MTKDEAGRLKSGDTVVYEGRPRTVARLDWKGGLYPPYIWLDSTPGRRAEGISYTICGLPRTGEGLRDERGGR